jgi:hypothetical protein
MATEGIVETVRSAAPAAPSDKPPCEKTAEDENDLPINESCNDSFSWQMTC